MAPCVEYAVRQALAVLAGCSMYVQPGNAIHARHPTESDLRTFYGTVYEMADDGSAWAGCEASREWWVACAWTVAQAERNQHDNDENCEGGAPGNGRSAGFVNVTGPAWRRACACLNLSVPLPGPPSCWDAVGNPRKQAQVFVALMARNLRARQGRVNEAWQVWRYGHHRRDDYASGLRTIWASRWRHVPFRVNLSLR